MSNLQHRPHPQRQWPERPTPAVTCSGRRPRWAR